MKCTLMRKLAKISILLILCFQGKTQQSFMDLNTILSAPDDSVKVLKLIEKSTYYVQIAKFDSARLLYDKALQLSKKINYRFGELNVGVDLAGLEMKKGNYDLALKSYYVLLEAAKTKNFKSIEAKIYNGIGTIYFEKTNINEAISYFIKSSLIYELIHEDSRLGASYINIGAMYSELKNDDLAYKYYFKAVEVFNKTGNNNYIIAAWHNIGIIHQDKGRLDSANYYYSKALKLSDETQNINQLALSYNYLGSLLVAEKSYEKAIVSFNKALHLINQIGDINWRAHILLELTDAYLPSNNADKVIELVKEVQQINLQIGSLSIKKDCYKQLWHAYRIKGQHVLADEFVNLFVQVNDSLINSENVEKMAELNAKYENDKIQKQIEIKNEQLMVQRAKIEKSDFEKKVFITGSIFLLGLFIILIRGYSLIKKRNQEISIQKEQIQDQNIILEVKQKEILDSIRYAKRIQQALLPSNNFLERKIGNKKT